MILTKEECQKTLTEALKYVTADSAVVSLGGDDEQLVRYANNMVFTNLSKADVGFRVTASFGDKSGNSSTNQLDSDSIKKCVAKAEEIARYAPPDPEFMPPLAPQKYQEISAYFKETADFSPTDKTNTIRKIIAAAQKQKMTVYGTMSNSASFTAIANSKGLFGYHKSTNASCTTTAKTSDRTGSAKTTRNEKNIRKLDAFQNGVEALEKAKKSRNPKTINPGDYTVIFESTAVADLLVFVLFFMEARAADEKRSFMCDKDGNSKLGQKIFGENITIKTLPDHPDLLATPFDFEGLPVENTEWIKNGVVKNLYYTRYWAKVKGKKPNTFSTGIVMDGGDATMEKLIKSVKKGIYVSRLFYIRVVNPMTLQITGLTRDGIFLIDNGQIKEPLVNLRFNESMDAVLNNITMMSKPQIAIGEFELPMLLPAIKVENFTFSSIAPSV